MNGGYRALDELRSVGAIKAIGAGVNEWEVAEALARAGDFDVFLLAGRYTLLEQDALTSFLPLCAEKGIGVVVGGPFNSGILATGVKADAHYNYGPAPEEVKERVRRIQQVCKASRSNCRRRPCAFRSAIRRWSASSPARSARAKPNATP